MNRPRPRLSADAASGLFLAAVGGFVIWEASSYRIGTFGAMGPGMFPLLLGIGLVALGLAIAAAGGAAESARDVLAEAAPAMPRVAVLVLSVISFVWIYRLFGLIAAIVVLVLVASAIQRPLRPISTLVSALVVAAFTTLIFSSFFGIPLVPYRWPF